MTSVVRKMFDFSRRKLLKATGASISGLAGVASVDTVAANQRSGSKDENEPKSANNGNAVYAKGTFQNPVTPDTIRELHNMILANEPSDREATGAMLPDPTAEPAEEFEHHENIILGYGVKWKNNSPHIQVKQAPKSNSMSDENKQYIIRNSHSAIDRFVNGQGDGQR